MGVGNSPAVVVAEAVNRAMQDLFHAEKADLFVNKALVLGMPANSEASVEFKLAMYSAARETLIDAVSLMAQLSTHLAEQFPIISPPVPHVPRGVSADQLIAKADRWAARAADDLAQVSVRLDLAQIGIAESGDSELAAQVQAAKEVLQIAIDQLLAGLQGSKTTGTRLISVEPAAYV